MQNKGVTFSASRQELAERARKIPLFARAERLEIVPLEGVISLNNANYKVTSDGKAYLLRCGAETAKYLGIRRHEEIAAARYAAKAGIGAEVLYSDDEGTMVMPYLSARHWTSEDFHKEANIVRVASTLRKLHDVRDVPAEGSVYRRIERLLESAGSLSLDFPLDLDLHLKRLKKHEVIRTSSRYYRPSLCHNDFWANNFLDDGERLWLVDWEFSGNGDGFYDLATACLAGQYSEAEQRRFLYAYGCTEPEDYDSLQLMHYLVLFFEASWGLVMHGLRGSEEWDYQGHSLKTFQRLEALSVQLPLD